MEVPGGNSVLFLVISVSTAPSSPEERKFKEKSTSPILNLLNHRVIPGENIHLHRFKTPLSNPKFGTRPIDLGITSL